MSIDKMQRLGQIARPGSTLSRIINEVNPLVGMCALSTVPTSGSAVCRYDTATGRPLSYEVRYQQGNVGNLVHELIHVAVNQAYGHDFVNYPNRNANAPARVYDNVGRCTNEFDRQTAYMDHGENGKIAAKLQSLSSWANAAQELTAQQRNDIVSKFNYGLQWPMKEYDTVITQVLVWLVEWGYPMLVPPGRPKPVVNALFEEVERAVEAAYNRRRTGV